MAYTEQILKSTNASGWQTEVRLLLGLDSFDISNSQLMLDIYLPEAELRVIESVSDFADFVDNDNQNGISVRNAVKYYLCAKICKSMDMILPKLEKDKNYTREFGDIDWDKKEHSFMDDFAGALNNVSTYTGVDKVYISKQSAITKSDKKLIETDFDATS